MTKTSHSRGIVLFSHGSRDPLWRAPIEAVQECMAATQPDISVRCAYLELCLPDLPTAAQDLVDAGIRHLTIVPMFLGAGRHAREDLPRLVEALRSTHAALEIHVQQPIGEDLRMTALMADIAGEPAPTPDNPSRT